MWHVLSKEMKGFILIILITFIFGVGFTFSQWFNREKDVKESQQAIVLETKDESGNGQTTEDNAEIKVHITGCIVKSGVYTVMSGSRVEDVVKLAGTNSDSDLDNLNLAAPLIDGQKIIVPSKKMKGITTNGAASSGENTASGEGKGKININTADATQLDTLPGVGPSTAQKIVDYREKNGQFKKIEDIDNVPGIGPKKLEDLKSYITLY